jgi:hypothetical protein
MIWRNRATTSRLAWAMVALQLGCGGTSATLTELERVKADDLEVVVLSPRDAIQHGQDSFVLEFRRNGNLVDVGDVRATATMPMPGMPMFGSVDVQRTDVAGRYAAISRFEMAGTWRTKVEWDGQGGRGSGSVTFSGSVR